MLPFREYLERNRAHPLLENPTLSFMRPQMLLVGEPSSFPSLLSWVRVHFDHVTVPDGDKHSLVSQDRLAHKGVFRIQNQCL